MKYWVLHILLVGLLVAIWVPTIAVQQPVESSEAMENYSAPVERKSTQRRSEAIPPTGSSGAIPVPSPSIIDDSEDFVNLDDEQLIGPPEEITSTEEPVKTESAISWWDSIMDSMKEIASTFVLFGNVMTFFWQWKDRRKKKNSIVV